MIFLGFFFPVFVLFGQTPGVSRAWKPERSRRLEGVGCNPPCPHRQSLPQKQGHTMTPQESVP
jgi:hypothetical protein